MRIAPVESLNDMASVRIIVASVPLGGSKIHTSSSASYVNPVPVPPPPDAPPPPRPGPAGARHVLVVEDNMTNQIIVGGMLERLGCRWSSLTRGDQVLEAVEQARLADDPFDMILMDLHLPGMDGCDAAQSVRKAGFDGKQLPIIAVTANAFGEDVERCLAAGMQGHIAKPVRLRFLQKMLAQY